MNKLTKMVIQLLFHIEVGETEDTTIADIAVATNSEQKMPDLNAASLEAAMSMVAGTARSMGVVVED